MRNTWVALTATALLLTGCGAAPADATAHIQEDIKYVALTFDDGPRPGTTDVLLDGLKERGAAATFFLIGEEIAGRETLVRRMAAEGHQVGNHTWSHLRLEAATAQEVAQEIGKTEAAIGQILGGSGYYIRPPYGLLEENEAITVPLIKWSVDPRDWESRDKDKIVEEILSAVTPGSIILLHDIYRPSVDAALEVIDRLSQEGYWFVTVEELLGIHGITPQPGVLYRRAR